MASAAGTLPVSKVRADALPQGPRWPAVVQTVVGASAFPWLMDHCHARYGDVFTLKLVGGRTGVFVSGAEAVKEVLTAPPESVPSAAMETAVGTVLGPNSVLTLSGPEHMRMRRLLLPPFHGERMREYEQVIVEATRRSMSSWPLGEPVRMQDFTQEITLEVMLEAVFGMEEARMGPLKEAIDGLFALAGMTLMLLMALHPSSKDPTGRLGRAIAKLDGVIYAEIARRRNEPDLEARKDILSLLLQTRDEEGHGLTDVELRDELVTLLMAGHETTANSVTWAIERLVRHPDKLARLIAEIDAGEGDEYLQAVIHETLRVRPVVPTLARALEEPLRVGGHMLPRGTKLGLSVYLTNHDSRVYEEPRAFRPERFLGKRPETFSWISFGGGVRRCLGASFGLLEMRLILATVLQELQPSLPERGGRRGQRFRRGERMLVRPTLVARGGGQVLWRRRAA
jgi:cytochrome P450 family 135